MTPEQRAEFDLVCTPHMPALLGTAIYVCKNNRAAADDLVQQTMLNAMLVWDSYRPGSNARAWLYRILTNAYISDYRRRRHYCRILEEHPADLIGRLYGRDEEFVETERLSPELQHAMDSLDDVCRATLELDLRGHTCAEIAEMLDTKIGTVMSRLYRTREVLRAQLTDLARERGLLPVAPVAKDRTRRKAAQRPKTETNGVDRVMLVGHDL